GRRQRPMRPSQREEGISGKRRSPRAWRTGRCYAYRQGLHAYGKGFGVKCKRVGQPMSGICWPLFKHSRGESTGAMKQGLGMLKQNTGTIKKSTTGSKKVQTEPSERGHTGSI